nr:integrase, catalytic region, zinc finger, CCHC-type, peptidase aspartic, catalytic [Tanacetum cinerariifolium]
MTTLAEHIIVVGAENSPPMLEKSMYNSWASRRAHGKTLHSAKETKKFCMVQGEVNTDDLDAYDLDCDDISSAKAVLMANISSCDSDVVSKVPYSDTYLNDMINQEVQEMSYYEQTHIMDFLDNEITSDSNIIPYSQDLHESQDAEKVFAIAALKNELRKLKGKNVVDTTVSKLIATIALGMFKPDIETFSHRLKNNKDAHEVYPEKTIENTNTLRGLVGCASKQNPSEPLLESTCMFTKCVQELNDHIAKIMGYVDYQMGNFTISRVNYVEELGHNLFFVGQLCDSDLEVAFCKHTCFIRDLEGVDLLKRSKGSNLYTLSLDNLMVSLPIGILSKASKTKSWLWYRRLSHLNFDYITSLAKHGLVRGLPKLKYQKDHLCSAYALVIALKPAVSTSTPFSTINDHDAPSTSTSQTNQETPSPVIPFSVEEVYHDIE